MPLRINPTLAAVVCSVTGEAVDPGGWERPLGRCRCCPAPGRPSWVTYDMAAVRRALGPERLWDRPEAGMWKYEPLLPVSGVPLGYANDVGGTAVIASPRLSEDYGVELLFKMEGGNPTGSFQDRGAAVAIAWARACRVDSVCLASAGDAAVAAACFAARLGVVECRWYAPATRGASWQHAAAAHFGAQVERGGSGVEGAAERLRADLADRLRRYELQNISAFHEPGRLEGAKTLGFEIAEHLGPLMPDVILCPTTAGTAVIGIWKGLMELLALGDHRPGALPRLVVVQPEGRAPIVESWRAEADAVATGPAAPMGHRLLEALRESAGSAVAVRDEEVAAAFAALGRHGVPAGRPAASCLAAAAQLRDSGFVRRGARVLVIASSDARAALWDRASG